MAWQDEMVVVLRVLINDAGTTQAYTDDQLEQVIVVAARKVVMDADFPIRYAPLINSSDVEIVPDPTVGDNRNENFINLTCFQGACIIDRGSAMRAAGQAIRIKDGSSEVDLRDAFKAKLAVLEKGWCAVYQDSLDDYYTSQHGVVIGTAIMTPFRIFAGYGDDYFNL